MINRIAQLTLLITLALLGHFTADAGSNDNKSYRNISVDQFAEMVAHKDFFLINVHVPYEGEIANTDLLIPFDAVESHLDELPGDKNAKIVVYCMTGPMGHIASEKLVRMGYIHVIHLQGGMAAWQKSGRQLVNRQH